MKKATVVLTCVVLLAGFLALVRYGLRHSRGAPTVVAAEPTRSILEAPFIDKEIDLTKGSFVEEWNSIPSIEIGLMYQVMILPWGKSLVSPVSVKAFHNKKDIYFYMSWKDDTGRSGMGSSDMNISKFSDACAVMFPLDKEIQPSSIMMGFLGKTNIWQWKERQDREYWLKESPTTDAYVDFHYPFEEEETFVVSKDVPKSAINDLLASMPGTITPQKTQNIQGRGFWENGVWHVIFRRSMKPAPPELEPAFAAGGEKFIAFAVWNGAKGDRGGRKSISDWVQLKISSSPAL